MRLRLVSWNINGIRAGIKKGFWGSIQTLDLDVLCLQEIKAGQDVMSNLHQMLDYRPFVLHSQSATNRGGYSGVATFSRANGLSEISEVELFASNSPTRENQLLHLTNHQVGLGQEKFDIEGRLIMTHYWTESGLELALINAYYPQGGRGQFRIDYKIEFYTEVLKLAMQLKKQGLKVILCGDFNTTVTDIDLARPKENRKTTGCLPEEREALNWFFEAGFVDSFRHFHPDQSGAYTYWDQITRARERNVGWRIDYFMVDQELLPNLQAAEIHDQILGSDHCPISIDLAV
jgi:exodeoxyribonuclease III